ncbi:nucleotidyltransferase family protein [Pseudonocardia ammonioxydans]|uniref:nucleotidyltransferase family protein n=1 Tax=Pseudonocardia ammonioxydans TaxID=260086 RepID=UPI001C434910|nr:nucleotidyltransferase domain-containing protein [Pseudonocardia ammonioxydans]
MSAYGIASLSVLGSAARGDASPSSGVDLLYELRPGARLGWEIEHLTAELTAIFGHPVDLAARRALHPGLRDSVLDEARPVHAA